MRLIKNSIQNRIFTFDKNKQENSINSYISLQIQQFINRFFFKNKLIVHDYHITFSNSNELYVYVSFYMTYKIRKFLKKDALSFKKRKYIIKRRRRLRYKRSNKKIIFKRKLLPNNKFKLSIFNKIRINFFYKKFGERKLLKKVTSHQTKLERKRLKKKKKLELNRRNRWYKKRRRRRRRRRYYFYQINKYPAKTKRLRNLKIYQNLLLKKFSKTKQIKEISNFTNKFLTSLSLFLKNRYKINLFLKVVNKKFFSILKKKQRREVRDIFIALRRYSRNDFFKESLKILLISVRKQNSAKLLANFITHQLRLLKRHNFFLIFLKISLRLLRETSIYKICGIKIVVKGRFNGAPRARKRQIIVGTMPLNSICKIKNYHESTSYTKNGTFGVKVWIH